MENELLTGRVSNYEITQRRPFALGNDSALYLGKSIEGAEVCIKLFRVPPETETAENSTEEFINEIQAQHKLKHQNILSILDYGEQAEHEAGPFIVYPFCDKGTLRKIIKEKPYLPITEALTYLEQISLAIDYAHSCGFIHGDLKPENILFKSNRIHPLLCDFGMSRYFPRRAEISLAPDAGGTLEYLSPEQIEGGQQSQRSDIYSLGLVAHELLTGKLPFDTSATAFMQMQSKVSGQLEDPSIANPNLSKTVISALKSALEKDPNLRPKTAGEFCKMLRGEINAKENKFSIPIKFWQVLDMKFKVAVIVALIGALATIVAAFINVTDK